MSEQTPGSLIISRKLNESINIDTNIIVQVIQIDRYQVKLRIMAPKDVQILRSELLAKLQSEE